MESSEKQPPRLDIDQGFLPEEDPNANTVAPETSSSLGEYEEFRDEPSGDSNEIHEVRTGRVERFLQGHQRLLHYLDDKFPEGPKSFVRSLLRRESFPLEKPYVKKLGGVQAAFWIKNASDWHRIVQEDAGDSFPEELMSSIRPGHVFLDVGSAQGTYAILAAKAGAESYAVDPDPVSLRSVRENLEINADINDRVHLLNMGLGHKNDTLTLNYDALGIYAPSFQRTTRGLSEQITVPVRPVDELVTEGVIRTPDVIKIDVEGAEGMVLDGMQRLMTSASKPAHLFVEVHDLYLPKFGSSSGEILQKIADMGYVPYGGHRKERGKKIYHFVPADSSK